MDLTLIVAVSIGAMFAVGIVVDWRRRAGRAVDTAVVENAMREAEAAREAARAAAGHSGALSSGTGIVP